MTTLPRREKLFIGAQLRQIRAQLGVSQTAFAQRLGISSSYMSQLEHDQRAVSAAVLMRLSSGLGIDIAQLSSEEADRQAGELIEAIADPAYAVPGIEPRVARHLVRTAPELARAFLKSHQLNKQYEERLQALNASYDVAPVQSGREATRLPLPYDEVRDYFHNSNNYIASLDVAAERCSETNGIFGVAAFDQLVRYFRDKHQFCVDEVLPKEPTDTIYAIDHEARKIIVNGSLSRSTLSFQLAAIVGLFEQEREIDRLLMNAGFQSAQAKEICRISLANYFAGALLMPYTTFRSRAHGLRHDIEQLQHHFGTSFEQVCHRLSNLQRPGKEGIPFFFARVDRAGNITKRHSATKLQFVRYGGACPMWNVHQSFTAPGQVFVQVAETPDGTRYLSVARAIVKRAGRFDGYERHYAVALGCEISAAANVVYGDGLDLTSERQVTPIGVSCRICERIHCPQRAFPPLDRSFSTDPWNRTLVPYSLADSRSQSPE